MKYDFKMDYNKNNSLSLVIARIQDGTKVLEFGCANGRLTKYLKEVKKCSVSIVEIEEEAGMQAKQYADRACLGTEEGDIEKFIWAKKLKGCMFDYIIFPDVLEHLREPEEVLRICKKFLVERGSIIVSIPNFGNNSIFCSLFKNEFEYQDVGLLDNTHIKFYTYNTFKRMLGRLDYRMLYETGTYNKIGENEVPVMFDELPSSMRKMIVDRPFGDVYQFIFQFKNMDVEDDEINQLSSIFPPNAITYYEAVYYLKNDGVISEFNTCRFPVHKGLNKHIIKIEANMNVTSIRFDPINSSAVIRINTLMNGSRKCDLKIVGDNASISHGNVYGFCNSDPYFEIEGELCSDDTLEILYEVIDFELDTLVVFDDIMKNQNIVVKELESVVKELESEVTYLNEQLEIINDQRKKDLEQVHIQVDMLTKNNDDIIRLNVLIEEQRDLIKGKQAEIDHILQKIAEHNKKFYHIKKIK